MKLKKALYLSLFSLPLAASAHELWVDTDYPEANQVLTANIAYGDFPALEEIPENRLHIFSKPMQLHTATGTSALIKGGEHNFTFKTEKPLPVGSYLVTAEYAPTFWSKNKDGWKQATLKTLAGATYCEESRMFGKKVVNVGDSKDTTFITKPLGQGLEIVPLDNPANAEVGKPFPLQVLFDGKPIEKETIYATFKGFTTKDPNDHYHKVEPQAFADTTRDDGTVQLYPLRAGQWKVRVVHKQDYPDQDKCQWLKSKATLTFDIGKPDDIKGFYADDEEKYKHAIEEEHKHEHLKHSEDTEKKQKS